MHVCDINRKDTTILMQSASECVKDIYEWVVGIYTVCRCVEDTIVGTTYEYAVATISWLLKIISFFCKRALWKRRYSVKETYDLKEPIHSFAKEVSTLNSSTLRKSRFLRVHIPDGTHGMPQFANQTLLCGSVKSIGVRCEFVTHICKVERRLMWVSDTYMSDVSSWDLYVKSRGVRTYVWVTNSHHKVGNYDCWAHWNKLKLC